MGLLTMIPLACNSHLLIDLPIFMGPVVVLVGWLVLMTRRARRQERLEGAATDQIAQCQELEIGHKLLGVHA